MALSLDSAGTGQAAYHLFSNPSGVQMDAIHTSASGEQFEVDLQWDSAGQITDDGYIVEMRVPLQTIRFSGGDEVRMGILFFRRFSRSGVSYSWPGMPPGLWVFDSPAQLVFSDLRPPRLVEILPSVTYGISQSRATPEQWNDALKNSNFGLSGKIGITSNITLDGTINPDFSQVESDAFQVETNQRFPIFFSEKRPFFMEGMGLFNIAGTGGDGNMRTAVHTRRIDDPSWGTKLTGTAGKVTFGLLNASDENADGVDGSDKLYTIGRATYALARSDYIGALVTHTSNAGRRNSVVGGDLALRPSTPQSISATFLRSKTTLPSGSSSSGIASQVSYSYNTRRFSLSNQVEHYGRDFQMDTAFFNRTDFTSGWSFGEINFYPREGSDFWLRRVHPFYFIKQGRDERQDGNETFANIGVRFNFTRAGFLSVTQRRGREPWIGQTFDTGGGINLNGNVQILPWLGLNGYLNTGREIFYDPVDPFQGESRSGGFTVTLQPNQRFNQRIAFNTVRFNRESTGERVFDVNIVNLRTTYQFNRRFLVRLLEQFDSSRHRLLTDLLASYEFVPGTVLHAGYGSLYERRSFENGQFGDAGGNYLTTSRGLFFKASYLHRF
jgi:hypothetical protein